MAKYKEGDFIAGYCDHPVRQFVKGIISDIDELVNDSGPSCPPLYYLSPVEPVPGYDAHDAFPVSEPDVEYWKPAEKLFASKEEVHDTLEEVYKTLSNLRMRMPGIDKDDGPAHYMGGILCDIDYIQATLLPFMTSKVI